MLISAVKCKRCNETIYSRCSHDRRWCKCRTIGITNGPTNVGLMIGDVFYKQRDMCYEHIEFLNINVDVTIKELYDDYELKINKYGLYTDPLEDLMKDGLK